MYEHSPMYSEMAIAKVPSVTMAEQYWKNQSAQNRRNGFVIRANGGALKFMDIVVI